MTMSTKRPRRQLTVTLYLPLHVETKRLSSSDAVVLMVHPSRALWQWLNPLLFDAPRRLARRATWFLLREQLVLRKASEWNCFVRGSNELLQDEESLSRLRTRRLSLNLASTKKKPQKNTRLLLSSCSITLIFRPSSFMYLYRDLEDRWIHLENQLIRAQSVAGYLSTLGGGFFMCHHWTTAVTCAQQQQQLARLLGDSSMFFKCLINQAYNYIYAGKFKAAKALLLHVYATVCREKPGEQKVLMNMVTSALLFRRRVKEAKQQLKDSPCLSKTMDDFGRIRLVRDESSADDMIRPFL